jgi:two-component system sensor histidine kinase/response regulator
MTKILVIEDEAPVLENIIELLEFEGGFEVIGAENGVIGLQRAQEHVPDLIICDITMPEMDGYEVLLEVRKRPKIATTPFMFLTARADRSFMRHGMEIGADDYLTKPFSSAELMAAILARLERHQMTVKETERDLEEAKSQLVQMVAHELRTPLVSIEMASALIADKLNELSPAHIQELMAHVTRGSERLHHLVEQMVLTTRLKAGVLTPELVIEQGLRMPVSDLLMVVIDLARRFAPRHPDVAVRLETKDGEAVIQLDAQALKHALAELVTNAISFSPEGEEVGVLQWVANGSVWIQIVDHGPGIPAEHLDQAQDEFQQINRHVQEQQGMGMGLPLARQIIGVHGGTLEIKSVVGQGTQVTVKLPAAGNAQRS